MHFGVVDEGDEAVLADGEFFFEDASAVFGGAAGFDGAVEAGEVDDNGIAGGAFGAWHFDEGAGGAGEVAGHGEGEHFDGGAVEGLEFYLEDGFVEGMGAGEVIDVDFEPADGEALWGRECGCRWVMGKSGIYAEDAENAER